MLTDPTSAEATEIVVRQVPEDTCLQCGQTRTQVKDNETFCGIVEGYEYPELAAEWPNHHWRDWSNKDLASSCVSPEFWDKYRRASVGSFEWVACQHSTFGHRVADEDDEEFSVKAGQCIRCGGTPQSI